MIKNILTLIQNDLAIAVKNKTIFLIFFIPLFVFFTLKIVDSKNETAHAMNLGLINNEAYSPVVIQSLKSSDKIFNVIYVETIEEGKNEIRQKTLDGLLLNTNELIILKKESLKTISMIEGLYSLQQTAENKKSWVSSVTALQSTDIQKDSLPTWILMMVLLVGFVIMPSQVAEEKEKKLLVSLLQTPMREIEWLMSKIFTGMILATASILILHLIGNFHTGINLNYILIILSGSFCFSSYGVLLGFLCRNQASARILGVIFYLPHLLPSALSDFSRKLDVVAPLLPSFHFYESIKHILFDQARIGSLGVATVYMLSVGVITFAASYFLMKKRWLM
ncbi:MAG: ABC transporter permease [Rhizobacter sp.]|nr:ABC transporter permease [Bacteriovorax sp.]